jgi:hypothetical protein
MTQQPAHTADPCLIPGVQPLLSELGQPVSTHLHTPGDAGRASVEAFLRETFRRHYDARLGSFYPSLLAFRSHGKLRAAVGFRETRPAPVFAEQYLPEPAERMIAAHWGEPVDRERMVEVGNLALACPGEARWVIAAVTTFLYARGYRWVLFTAVRPLFNAFRRLGLNPVPLAVADPARLAGGGREWGRYYHQQPVVCAGDIRSGHQKLCRCVSSGQPLLRQTLGQAYREALASPPTAAATGEAA